MQMNWDAFFEMNDELRPHADLLVIPPTHDEATQEFPEIAGTELTNHGYEYAGRRPITRLALYMISRRKGNSHSFATACALQRFPGTKTEDVFWGGRKHFAEVYGDDYFKRTVAGLERKGVKLTAHDEYFPELARFPADPEAVVSRSQGRGYIKKLCERRGWACEGAVNVRGRGPERDELADENCVPLANDLVQNHVKNMVQQNPSLKTKSRHELRSMVLEKHARGK